MSIRTLVNEGGWLEVVPAYNRSSVPIRHGSVICRDFTVTDSATTVQVAKQTNSVAIPSNASTVSAGWNLDRIIGIAKTKDGVSTGDERELDAVVGGLCQALVTIPAYCNAVTDTQLSVYATPSGSGTAAYYDVTPLDSATLGWGSLAPMLSGDLTAANRSILQPANPVAVLREALDNSAGTSATTVLRWVEVLPYHRPQSFVWNATYPLDEFSGTATTVCALSGSNGLGVIDKVLLSSSAVPGLGLLTVNVLVGPCVVGGTTTSGWTVLSTGAAVSKTTTTAGILLGYDALNDGVPTYTLDSSVEPVQYGIFHRVFGNPSVISAQFVAANLDTAGPLSVILMGRHL